MKRTAFTVYLILTVIIIFAGCKKTSAPTMPDPNGPGLTVTQIISESDSLRATQTYEAAGTSTALAVLFTRTVTMTVTKTITLTSTPTITVTSTITSTITPTVTMTVTPYVYIIYDTLNTGGVPDPAKWDIQASGDEIVKKAANGLMDLRTKTTVPGTEATLQAISKFPDGTLAFKGEVILHAFTGTYAYEQGEFRVELGNTQDGFTLLFSESVTGNSFMGGPLSFEVKHISGTSYSCSFNGYTASAFNFQHQPQIKLYMRAYLYSNFVGANAETVYWAKNFYYY